MSSDESPRRPRYGYWLLASVRVALFIDFWFCAFAAFAWCGLGTCRYEPGDAGFAIGLIVGIFVVTFLAVALPPWTPGRKRPLFSAAAGLVAAGVAAVVVFSVGEPMLPSIPSVRSR